MRDARPFLQIAHVGPLAVASAARLSERRARALRGEPIARGAFARHDPSALLAVRRWIEAVTVGDAAGRKLPTWIVEVGPRSAFGDLPSLELARRYARVFASGGCAARVVIPGPEDVADAEGDAHFGARHPGHPLCLRAPHGAWEVQLYAQDTARDPEAAATRRTRSLRDEHAPVDETPILLLAAAHSQRRAAPRMDEAPHAWFVTEGDPAWEVSSSCGVRDRDARPTPQCVSLVRVYASPSARRAAILERMRFVRPLGAGPFRLHASEVREQVIALE
jgi:hypothetical protein